MTKEATSVVWKIELRFPAGANPTREAVESYLERNCGVAVSADEWRLKCKLRAIEKHSYRIEAIVGKPSLSAIERVKVTAHRDGWCATGIEDFIVRYERIIRGD